MCEFIIINNYTPGNNINICIIIIHSTSVHVVCMQQWDVRGPRRCYCISILYEHNNITRNTQEEERYP